VLIAPVALLLALADSPAPDTDVVTPARAPAATAPAAAPAPAAERAGASAEPAVAQGGGGQNPQGLRFVWRDHPSLRAGRWLRLDFGAKFQGLYADPGDDPIGFDKSQLSRARVGVDGELFRVIQFSIERDLTSTSLDEDKFNAKSEKTPWRDLWVELKVSDALQIRGGRFKIPFGLDQLTGVTNNDFITRSLGGVYLSPARDRGGMVHGRFFGRGLNYSVGLFEHDGDNSRSRKVAGGDRTFAARVSGTPFPRLKALNFDKAEFGGNFATTEMSDKSELPNGLRGRTVVSQYTFFEPVFVKGTRNRYGADVEWSFRSVGARAEYIVVTDERKGQGLRGDDLNSARARSYYVTGSWVVTGDRKERPLEPRQPLFFGGAGAVEVVARYDRLWFDSKKTGEPAFSNSRAEVILPNGDKVWTLGLNWYVNRWVKLQLNGIHEEIQDFGRTPLLDGGTKFWSTLFGAQLVL
jgi:phosphate-selective porin OprO/OprP